MSITNFGGNVAFAPRQHYTPSTEAEVLEILDRHAHGKVRVGGALHSWSPAVVSDDALVDMRRFDGVEFVNTNEGPSVIAGGGCRIKDLLDKLHALGDFTLPSIGLITEQSIAGAISTATHGSGRSSLSHYVVEVRMAAFDESGKACIHVWNGGDELRAARCALGCMGIILSVRIRCVLKYAVAETIVPCATLEDVLAGEEEHPMQQFYLVPHLWSYFAQRRKVSGEFSPNRTLGAGLYRAWWYLWIDLGLHLVIKLLASLLRSPAGVRFFYRHVLSKLILKNVTVIDRAERMLVMEHELFKHLEIEIFVPAEQVRAASAFVQASLEVFDGASAEPPSKIAAALRDIGLLDELLQRRGSFTHHYAITFRRVLPDDALISMTSGARTWYAISFITYVEPRDDFYAMASFLSRAMVTLFEARLHWGKYFPLTGVDIEKAYPRLPDFRAICRRVDPHGVFRNDFVNRVLFSAEV